MERAGKKTSTNAWREGTAFGIPGEGCVWGAVGGLRQQVQRPEVPGVLERELSGRPLGEATYQLQVYVPRAVAARGGPAWRASRYRTETGLLPGRSGPVAAAVLLLPFSEVSVGFFSVFPAGRPHREVAKVALPPPPRRRSPRVE